MDEYSADYVGKCKKIAASYVARNKPLPAGWYDAEIIGSQVARISGWADTSPSSALNGTCVGG